MPPTGARQPPASSVAPPTGTSQPSSSSAVPVPTASSFLPPHGQRQPPATAQTGSALPSNPQPNGWVGELLQTPTLQRFVEFNLCTTTLDGEAIHMVEQVLAAMTARGSIQEALWYLEHFDWDVGTAVAQYHQDEAARMQVNSAQHRAMNQNANAVTRLTYHHGNLTFRGTETVGRRSHDVEFQFPRSDGFSPNNPDHLRALNQWLGDLVRRFNGPPYAPPAESAEYTVFEENFVRSIFADRDYANGETPGFPQIVAEFNAIFQGRYLPGAHTPCGSRQSGSITNLVDRRWRLDKTPGRRTNDSNRRAAETIRQTRLQEQQAYDRLRASRAAPAPPLTVAPALASADDFQFASDLFVQQHSEQTAPGGTAEAEDRPDFSDFDITDLQRMAEQAYGLAMSSEEPGPGEEEEEEEEDLSDGQPIRKRQRKE
ncbi:hypothetical protein A1O1_03833 [Capronia coronata CBS 617.96]|uniref:Uncharacterized protein n=1 Tax=Capronia coronata CBS 617.96 TaxID=1182541 RepID=W9Z878_9EURO|nr:uncharacterized protein A1O1_03833 [Capronia coronata CBS 617.96]EXJ90729.1 hypothetical protein A1O1_03833 [Capronia coronata CBS 617.96]